MPRPCQKFLPSALALLLMACAPAARSGDKALLIGLNKYLNIQSLHGTHNDVAAFRGLLVQKLGFKQDEIQELHDAEATHEGILQAIDGWLVQGPKPGDRVVLYYSGHGDQTPDRDGDERDDHQDETLIAYDAAADGKNMVLDDEIRAKLQDLAGREVLAVFDSCHSGTVTRAAFRPHRGRRHPPDWERAGAAATRGPTIQHQEGGGGADRGRVRRHTQADCQPAGRRAIRAEVEFRRKTARRALDGRAAHPDGPGVPRRRRHQPGGQWVRAGRRLRHRPLIQADAEPLPSAGRHGDGVTGKIETQGILRFAAIPVGAGFSPRQSRPEGRSYR